MAASAPATYDASTRTVGVAVGHGLEVVGAEVAIAPPLAGFANLAALTAAHPPAANRGVLARTADKATYWSDGAIWVEIVPPIGTYALVSTLKPLVYNGTAYPARPTTTDPVVYCGPSTVTPLDMQEGDFRFAES